MREEEIVKKITEDLKLQKKETERLLPQDLDKKWDFLVSNEPLKFINPDLTIKINILRNFRKFSIFIPDEPSSDPGILNLRGNLSGGRRGSKKLLRDSFHIIENNNFINLLQKYPGNRIGNPHLFRYKGCSFTYRWLKHIHFLGVMENCLLTKLQNDFIALDIGSSYGIFSYLLKKEFPKCSSILLDFPEQLILAHYYLGLSFPEAKIASYKEIVNKDMLDKDFLKNYDFVLIPWFLYKKISAGAIDLITNFASFGEMRKEWFNYYIESEPFLSTKYFFTANRFISAPTYDTDLTILDYPLSNFKKLHFSVCPIFSHTYIRKYFFFYKKSFFSSQYFEFIGKRNNQ